MKRYFIILLLINCINLCFSQQNVTFRIQSANVNPDFGLYQLDYLNEASYPKFFSKNSKQITFKISVPTFFYTTDISPTTILALPNDTFIIDKEKKIFKIGRKTKSENYTMKSLTDSLGQFNGVDAVDYILPVAKNPIKGTVNKYNLKDNIARDSILYSYYRKRVDFIKNNINIDFVYKNYWLRYFKYDYLLKSISGLILEEQSLESVTTFWECLDTTNLFRDTTLIHIDKYRSLIIHYLNYLSYKKHKANNSITNKLLIADSIEMNQNLKSWIFYTLAAKSVEKNEYNRTIYSLFNRNCSNSEYKIKFQKILDLYTISKKSNAETKLISYENHIKTLNDLIFSKQDSLVIIDFWATWCRPCIIQLQEINIIKNKYQNKKISFVFLSLDKDINAWSAFDKTKIPIPQNSFLVVNNFSSPLAKEFSIFTIPRTMIFKNKKIISTDFDLKKIDNLINVKHGN